MAPQVKRLKVFLVFSARDQELRVRKSISNLRWDEVAFQVDLAIPMPWGRLGGSIEIELPEGGPALIGVQLVEPPAAEPLET